MDNQATSKSKQNFVDRFAQKHPFLCLGALALLSWVLLTQTSEGQKSYREFQKYIASPLDLECDSYDGQLRIAIYISQPVYDENEITGSMMIVDNSHNFLISPADYGFKLKYQKDNYFADAIIIQEGNYRVTLMQNKKDALLIPNGGQSIPLLCYKLQSK